MTTQEKIAEIVKTRYNNFKGSRNVSIGKLHAYMRNMEKPLKLWQLVPMFLGFKVRREKMMTDEDYLSFLEKLEKENPVPVYKSPLINFNNQ